MKLIKSLIIAAIVMISFACIVYACDCDIPKSATEGLERSDAVFTGTVVRMKDAKLNDEMYDMVLVNVDRTWKGIDETQAIVYTDWSECNFDFTVGETYLLYSYQYEDQLHVSNCSRSALLSNASHDITELGEGKLPSHVVDLSGEFNRTDWNYTPVIIIISIVLLTTILGLVFLKVKK